MHISPIDQLRAFQPKIRLYFEKHPYIVKTVESTWELEAALRLRYRIFYGELLNQPTSDGLDMDELDMTCDHLVVVSKNTREIVGTYRLISSTFSERFYSAQTFDIAELLALPGHKVELGRACIAPGYRTGPVFSCLWTGITSYVDRINARYLFGCPRVDSTDPVQIASVCDYFHERRYVLQHYCFPPAPEARFASLTIRRDLPAQNGAMPPESLVPPLFHWYLKEGARVSAEPALDLHLRSTIFLALMDTSKLRSRFRRKFSRWLNCARSGKPPGIYCC